WVSWEERSVLMFAKSCLGVVAGDGGCPFRLRCPLATDLCATERPALRTVGGSAVACHYA
ncbi:ABC transporter ATP-binding protein, partial [Pseudarthrobacter sp. NKDBFgelt]